MHVTLLTITIKHTFNLPSNGHFTVNLHTELLMLLCTGEVEEGELAITESAEQRAAAVEAAREAAAAASAAAVEKAARATGTHTTLYLHIRVRTCIYTLITCLQYVPVYSPTMPLCVHT
jgi:hypothetical protein